MTTAYEAPAGFREPDGTPPAAGTPPTAVEDLWERLGHIERRVRHAVALRQDTDPEPNDPYRGQYLTPAAAERILDSRDAFLPVPAHGPDAPPHSPAEGRIAALAENFGLVAPDVGLLLVAMAPDIDARFEWLYGYLNDDLTRRRATIGLALELCGLPAAGSGRFRFSPSAPWSRPVSWRCWTPTVRCSHGCCAYRTGSPLICSATTGWTEGCTVSSGWPGRMRGLRRSRTGVRRRCGSWRRWVPAAAWCISWTAAATPAGWPPTRSTRPDSARWWWTSRPWPPPRNRCGPRGSWRPRRG